MATLSIFANFFIDTEERFIRMKDSFTSFKDIQADKWVINIRGKYHLEAMNFLKINLGNKLIEYKLNSEEGWFYDTRIMAADIKTDYVLVWLEDHINLMANISKYDEIIDEMHSANVEYMLHTFFWTRNRYNKIDKNESKNILWLDLTFDSFSIVLKNHPSAYIIAYPSILSQKLFKKIIFSDDNKQAIKWTKEVPFSFEKSSADKHWLPIRIALPKFELFASIDDDVTEIGSCLISRGLYPNRISKHSYANDNLIVSNKKTRIYLNNIIKQFYNIMILLRGIYKKIWK